MARAHAHPGVYDPNTVGTLVPRADGGDLVQFAVRLRASKYAALKQRAKGENKAVSAVACALIEQGLEPSAEGEPKEPQQQREEHVQ